MSRLKLIEEILISEFGSLEEQQTVDHLKLGLRFGRKTSDPSPEQTNAVRNRKDELKALAEEELQTLARSVRENKAKVKEAAQWYRKPEHKARYAYWLKMPVWNYTEGLILLAGFDPNFFILDEKKRFNAGGELQAWYYDYKTLAKRYIDQGQLSTQATPKGFLTWAKLVNLPFPKELDEELQNVGLLPVDCLNELVTAKEKICVLENQAPQEAKALNIQERQSLLFLIAGMAVGGYAFDPMRQRNDATSDIESDLHRLGLRLDKKTILKWLREACEELPGQST